MIFLFSKAKADECCLAETFEFNLKFKKYQDRMMERTLYSLLIQLYEIPWKYKSTIVMHSELSITTLYLISNLQTPLRYSWYSYSAE